MSTVPRRPELAEVAARRSEMDPMTVLPKELLALVASFLSPRDLLTLEEVNCAWRDFAQARAVWLQLRLRFALGLDDSVGDSDSSDDVSVGSDDDFDSTSCCDYSLDEDEKCGPCNRLRLVVTARHLDTLVVDANRLTQSELEAIQQSRASVRRLVLMTSHRLPHVDPPWALQLLRRVAPHVEELSLAPATRSMLAELHTMPRLRRLKVEYFAMSMDEEPVMAIASPSEPGVGIEWLRVCDLPQIVTELLLRAYGHSLKEVMLSVGASKDADCEWPLTVATETLVPMMQRCRLRVLRRWVRLGRRCLYPAQCCEQRGALRAVLPPTCAVLCGGPNCDLFGDHAGEDFNFCF